MKKGGILTACRVNNNGTDLQCAAMYHIFSKFFTNVEVINYISPFLERSRHIFKSLHIKDVLKIPYYLYMNVSHSTFRKKHIKLSQKKYYTIQNLMEDYSFVIVGSDQIWNLDITRDIGFYLPSLSHTAKLSYAASIGKNDLSFFDNNFSISSYLKEFETVSVREKSAVLALSKIGVESQENLDPILMAGKTYLFTLFKKKVLKQKYILLYGIDYKKEIIEFAKEKAAELKCKIIMISSPTFRIKGIKIKSFVGLGQWLNYMASAECIITDSYHCVSTAIAFEKELFVFDLDSDDKNTRTACLLNKVGAKKHITQDDYFIINKNIDKLRIESFNYIKRLCTEYGN